MKIIFIRHGEPDYSLLEEAGYTGFGLDLAPLSAAGRRMATEAAANPLLEQAEILISSEQARKLFFENNDFLPAESPVRYETAEQMKVRFSML